MAIFILLKNYHLRKRFNPLIPSVIQKMMDDKVFHHLEPLHSKMQYLIGIMTNDGYQNSIFASL